MAYRGDVVRLVLEQGYRATNAEQASSAMQAVFGVGTATVESQGSLRYQQWSLVDDGISATHVESSGALVHVDAAPAPDMVVIAVRSGYTVLKHGAETVALQAGDLGLIPLDEAVRMSWEQVSMNLYSFPRSSLRHLLSSDTEHVSLRVERLKAASPTLTQLWTRTAATLGDEVLKHSELAESDVIREQAIEALIGLTIEAFGIADADEDHDDDQAIFERSATYMQSNLANAISVTDVARAVGISIRHLQLVFRRIGQGTPLAHLRALRMASAQRAVQEAGSPVPLTEIARRCGYTNLGRFDAHYFDAFGTLPEQHVNSPASPTPDVSPAIGE